MANALPPPLADLEADLGYAPGELAADDPTEATRATRALKDATTLVLAEVPPTVATTWRTDAPDVIDLVVRTAARRGFENPRGINQETLGEHTVGLSDATGVYLTARELQQVHRAASGRRTTPGFVGTVRTPSAYGDGV